MSVCNMPARPLFAVIKLLQNILSINVAALCHTRWLRYTWKHRVWVHQLSKYMSWLMRFYIKQGHTIITKTCEALLLALFLIKDLRHNVKTLDTNALYHRQVWYISYYHRYFSKLNNTNQGSWVQMANVADQTDWELGLHDHRWNRNSALVKWGSCHMQKVHL